MADLPDTRESLLLKLRDPRDTAAWERFVAVYRPAVYRLALRRGLQDADADDLAQQVMANVSRALGHWRKDPERGTFRNWLLRIARNAIVNVLTRRRPDGPRGGTSVLVQLEQQPDREDAIDSLIEEEYRHGKRPSWKTTSTSAPPAASGSAIRRPRRIGGPTPADT